MNGDVAKLLILCLLELGYEIMVGVAIRVSRVIIGSCGFELIFSFECCSIKNMNIFNLIVSCRVVFGLSQQNGLSCQKLTPLNNGNVLKCFSNF